MDEPSFSGVGSVKDSSGQNNNGTPVGAKTSMNGKFGGAASFDGTSYINVPDSASLHYTTGLTYTAWVYPTMLNGYRGILAKRVNDGVGVVFTMFLWVDDKVYVDVPGARYPSLSSVLVNQWTHIAVVFDATKGRVSTYINGNPEGLATASTDSVVQTSDLAVGLLPMGGSMDPNAYFIGLIDEVAIWDRTLSQTDIIALANATGPL